MKQKFVHCFVLFAFLTKCSSVQPPPILRPTPYTVDVAPAPLVDDDAYTVTLPTVPDVSLRLAGDAGELLVGLGVGQPAPFAGVLFNGPATARLEVEFRAQAARCLVDRRADLDLLAARARTDLRLLQTSFNTQAQAYHLMLASRDEEIERLYQRVLGASRPNYLIPALFGVGGVVLGLGAGLLIGLFH